MRILLSLLAYMAACAPHRKGGLVWRGGAA
jgi:hypothetical protein